MIRIIINCCFEKFSGKLHGSMIVRKGIDLDPYKKVMSMILDFANARKIFLIPLIIEKGITILILSFKNDQFYQTKEY